jgi:hypothetical protein
VRSLETNQNRYQKIWFTVDEGDLGKCLIRMKKLRRTLRDQPQLGALVKEITLFGVQELYRTVSKTDKEVIISILGSLIMACPNLERLRGFHADFDHEYDRLTHALSTRPNLKERVWLFRGIEEGWDSKGNFITNQRPVYGDGSIANGDVFLSSHTRWSQLDTLILFGRSQGNLDYRAFVGTFRSLPTLKHLVIANFSATQFNDRTLAAIPPALRSLRLQDLPGLTDRGLTRLSGSYAIESLRSLALINTPLQSAVILSRILQNAPYLTSLAVVQPAAPTIDPSHPAAARPLYASNSLTHLHWDISPMTGQSLVHIASSIRSGVLPLLRWVRAPCDDGTIQVLCRPRARVSRPDDAVTVAASSTMVSLRTSLAAARLLAQERLEKARLEPLMAVVVTDESGVVLSNYFIRGFMGKLGSLIEYVLEGEMMEMEGMIGGRSMLMSGSGNNCSGTAALTSGSKSGILAQIQPAAKTGQTHREMTKMKIQDNAVFFM